PQALRGRSPAGLVESPHQQRRVDPEEECRDDEHDGSDAADSHAAAAETPPAASALHVHTGPSAAPLPAVTLAPVPACNDDARSTPDPGNRSAKGRSCAQAV